MKQEDLIKVYAYAENLWNTFKPEQDKFKGQIQDEIWFELLKDFDTAIIKTAMVEYSKVSEFCNIGKIARECENLTAMANNEIIDEDEIFKEIDRAILQSDKEQAFNGLSEVAKKVVGDKAQLVRWGMAEIENFDTVIASNIKRNIRNVKASCEKIRSLQHSGLIEIGVSETKRLTKGE